jgi:hypothetical protein
VASSGSSGRKVSSFFQVFLKLKKQNMHATHPVAVVHGQLGEHLGAHLPHLEHASAGKTYIASYK